MLDPGAAGPGASEWPPRLILSKCAPPPLPRPADVAGAELAPRRPGQGPCWRAAQPQPLLPPPPLLPLPPSQPQPQPQPRPTRLEVDFTTLIHHCCGSNPFPAGAPDTPSRSSSSTQTTGIATVCNSRQGGNPRASGGGRSSSSAKHKGRGSTRSRRAWEPQTAQLARPAQKQTVARLGASRRQPGAWQGARRSPCLSQRRKKPPARK